MRQLLFFLLLWLGICLPAAALPTADLLKSNLAGLGERKLPEAEQQAVQQALEQTLGWLENAERARASLQELQEQVAGAPEQIRKKAMRSRCAGFMLAWILKTKAENASCSGSTRSSPAKR